ncbi:hypothetical protein N789_03950 [Arenimonas oryziterrae DSM 21050 = YC6267]|uniref:Tail specific protease domain-containing protein n=1 Tax=Arenimonas oryziterrae DSM 21050 = YC6267 TaxID=1121015 RepID=A0A091B9C7_9GAMM|nr:hypothetical protein N789_03950 [Arenimonas oryziterrae DSM 21050 = YC6267]
MALAALFLLFPALASATAPARLTPKQAARELRLLERALTDLHPGLYRYQTEAGLAAEFAAARAQVAEGAEPGEMFLLATRLTASVRCGHTWTNPLNQSEAMQAVLADLPALPVRVRLLQGRLLVTASADAAMHRHDEILAIDGRSVTSLVAELMPYLRADGSSDGKRLSQIDSVAEGGVLDRLLPLLHAPQDGVYVLRLRAAAGGVRTVHVRGQHVADREKTLLAAGLAEEDIRWRLTFAGDTATLTLPTFAFWNSEFDWRGFLQRSFDTLTERHVTRLIIDLRQNEGGDSAVGNALVSYLIAAPHALPVGRVESAYERVPYDLAHYLDTWDFSFFDRTGLVERSPGQRNWRLKAQPAPVVLMPRAPRFAGKTIALIGPRMSSAGYLVARDLQASHAATLIGEPTGGNRRGLNGGELAWLTLPYSGVSIDIPLIAAVYEGAPDTGVTPDRVVPTTIEDVIAGRDAVMAAARR